MKAKNFRFFLMLIFGLILFSCSKEESDETPAYQSCPDDKHPHAIDLGLPSGTKWCCCNVGASSPEGYGGYYAWGETKEKKEYTWDNYAYDNINIGDEISGTKYDVAHVVMSGSWRMPTLNQMKELINNCTSEWTQLNGVNGRLVTGPNGGQIFLPAAGFRGNPYLDLVDVSGEYWSGSLDPDRDIMILTFDYFRWNLEYGSGMYGLSVRPVCP